MLGWQVYIRKYPSGSEDHATSIAKWSTGVFGLSWLDDLAKSCNATDLGGDGYPKTYRIKASMLRSVLEKGMPPHNSPAVTGEDHYSPAGYSSDIEINKELLAACSDDEELVVEAWDMS